MRAALKELGYDGVYHMMSVVANPRDADMWIDALNAKFFGKGKPFEKKDWDQLLGNVEVIAVLIYLHTNPSINILAIFHMPQ